MLKSAMNEWAFKAIQLETAVLALEEVGLPGDMKALCDKAEQALLEVVRAWNAKKPQADTRKWKVEPAQPQGTPQDDELVELLEQMKEDGVEEWTLHRLTSDKGDTVETLVTEDRAWMSAGGEYYSGQWDEEKQELDVGRDDEEGELGTGLVLNLRGELVFESQLKD
ncbi:hypothetical protein [Melittangium boletus]|uniref:Uncharacterized protein n=1 Tax=Melittangium boletus DSM 14713 TaxID=1294270 RepID=A0A250IGV1_9BACT|nr:hypothetical protein [Melittangium boletus]ATB30498.1 hypothetical protein MEBOL_003959 [Melittangium boletus DSM 14713]